MQHMRADSEKDKGDEVVKISNVKVVVQDTGKRPMVFGKSVNSSVQRLVMADDHEASSSSRVADKYHQLVDSQNWQLLRPTGLTGRADQSDRSRPV